MRRERRCGVVKRGEVRREERWGGEGSRMKRYENE